jgi:hypothetical protein
MQNMQVTATFYQERGKDIHSVVEICVFDGDEYIGKIDKICRNLERMPLTHQLLHYELTNGFPSFSPFAPRDFGGYTHIEVMDQLENSLWQEIAYFCLDESSYEVCCRFDLMNDGIIKLLKETTQILEEEAKSAGINFAMKME